MNQKENHQRLLLWEVSVEHAILTTAALAFMVAYVMLMPLNAVRGEKLTPATEGST